MMPFQVSRWLPTSAKVHGMAIAKPEGIKLVFHDEGVDVDPDDVEVQSAVITWDNFRSLAVDHGFFQSEVTFEVASLSGLEKVPVIRDGKLVVDVPKRDRDKIEQFERDVADHVAGKKSANLDDEVDDLVDDVRDMFNRRHDF